MRGQYQVAEIDIDVVLKLHFTSLPFSGPSSGPFSNPLNIPFRWKGQFSQSDE